MHVNYNRDLYHIGMPFRSGRFKWGSGENPYHHGADAPGGRLRRKFFKSKSNQTSSTEEKLRKPTDKQRMEIINSGDPQLVYKYRKYLSTNDLNAAKNRIDAENNIKKYADDYRETGLDKFERYADKWERTAKSIDKYGQGYNKVAKYINLVSDVKLPTLPEDNKSNKPKFNVKTKNKVKNKNKGNTSFQIDKSTTINVPNNIKSATVTTNKDGSTTIQSKFRRPRKQKNKKNKKK